jgi:Tfp pilus assembly protein PilO
MKNKILSLILVLSMLSGNALAANCDYANDIKKVDGGYLYTSGCHIEVGKKVKGYSILAQQVVELEKTITLKDLALSKSDERANMWMDKSVSMAEKVNAYESARSADAYKNVALGVLGTALAVWAAGQLRSK